MRALGRLRLGVNIDHVATLRDVGGGLSPDPLRAALLAEAAGADCIVTRLGSGEAGSQSGTIAALMAGISLPLTLSITATRQACDLAMMCRPESVCLWPGAAPEAEGLAPLVADLRSAGLRVILGATPDAGAIAAAASAGAQAVLLETRGYAEVQAGNDTAAARSGLSALREAARVAHGLGLEVQFGGGLAYDSAADVAAIPEGAQVTVGHFLIGEAIFRGLGPAIEEMRRRLDAAREGWA